MSVSKDPERGTFYVQCRYKDWTGEPKKKTKRGFKCFCQLGTFTSGNENFHAGHWSFSGSATARCPP